jgi:hypothetical protein
VSSKSEEITVKKFQHLTAAKDDSNKKTYFISKEVEFNLYIHLLEEKEKL